MSGDGEVNESLPKDVYARLDTLITRPMFFGRCSSLCLLSLQLLRASTLLDATILPGHSTLHLHTCSVATDVLAVIFTMPLWVHGPRKVPCPCLSNGFGLLLSLVFFMWVFDSVAFCTFCANAAPRPTLEGRRPVIDVVESRVGAWDFVLVASFNFHLALLTSCWRVYRELRIQGLEPPGRDPAGAAEDKDVSVLEVICEVDDLDYCARQSECRPLLCKPAVPPEQLVETIAPQRKPPSVA